MRQSYVHFSAAIAFLLMTLLGTVAQAGTIEMTVNGLVCGFCAQGIEKNLRKLPATADVLVSLEKKLVVVATKENQDIPDGELRRVLTEAGYDVKAIERTHTSIAKLREELTGKPQ